MEPYQLFNSTLIKVAFEDTVNSHEKSAISWNDLTSPAKTTIVGALGGAGLGTLSGIGTDKKLRNGIIGGVLGAGGGFAGEKLLRDFGDHEYNTGLNTGATMAAKMMNERLKERLESLPGHNIKHE